MSPFNIGRRIVVTDFTAGEAAPLAKGLGQDGDALLARVLYWTGGNPYLTQRLCRAIAEEKVTSAADVDRLCDTLFLSKSARDTDDNLSFVRNRLLRSEADLASLLDLYQKVRAGKRVPDDETNPLTGILRLSGVAKVENGLLRVRNRIYDRVFDKEWVTAHMPDAELRRQRAAYRRGVRRTAAALGTVLAVIGGLAFVAAKNARIAQSSSHKARQAAVSLRQNLYAADINVAQQVLEGEMPAEARDLLAAHVPKPGEEDLRTFEWRYLQSRLPDQSLHTFTGQSPVGFDVAFSPDGKLLATTDDKNNVVLWNVVTREKVPTLRGHRDLAVCVAFSPDGRTLASSSRDGTVRLWDVARRREKVILKPGGEYTALGFSPDGSRLVAGYYHSRGVTVWDPSTGRVTAQIPGFLMGPHFSPDGRLLLVATGFPVGLTSDLRAWDVRTGKPTPQRWSRAYQGCFSPDGRTIALARPDYSIALWDVARNRLRRTLPGHKVVLDSLAFSPDGRTLASSSNDTTVKLWDVDAGTLRATFQGHTRAVDRIIYSPDGRMLASASMDGTVKLWNAGRPRQMADQLRAPGRPSLSPDGRVLVIHRPDRFANAFYDAETLRPIAAPEDTRTTGPPVAFSPEEKTLLLADPKNGSIQLRDRASGRVMHRLRGYGHYRFSAFSPDGRQLLVAYGDNTVRSWDVATGKEQGVLRRPPTLLTPMRFSPDGRFLALVDSVYEVVVWNATGMRSLGKPLKRFQAHGGGTRAFAFSPDGETLATGGVDGTIKMWNTRTWRLTLVLPQHRRMLTWLEFSPDGQRLYSAGSDETVRVWRAGAATPPLSTKGPIP
jgi:WD40 repeat protein